MTNEEFLEGIKNGINLHMVVNHLAIVATRLFQLESDLAEIKNHLGIKAKKTDGEEK